ncbi:MAG: hypothetical protein KAG19_02750 [Methylococcales bacterium]|nr:hypothetical protein [Methylococcales bacterium]
MMTCLLLVDLAECADRFSDIDIRDDLFAIDSFGGKRCRYSTLRKMKEYAELFALLYWRWMLFFYSEFIEKE